MTQDQIQEKLDELERKLTVLWEVSRIHREETQSQILALQIELASEKPHE